jgi:(1->4)-alpha-D-glucan 1-alpha-D-glucosylmutase
MTGGARIPLATYRLQLHRGFGFRDARAVVGYLADLGITDVYASPLLAARSGSSHGYDVTDPLRVNPELGTDEELDEFAAALRARGLGLLLDIVPNHMSASSDNRWWLDVVEHGRGSPFAAVFDIDWSAAAGPAAGLGAAVEPRVLLPVLGGPFGEVLERGELVLVRTDDGFAIRYFDRQFPLAPRSWRRILTDGIDQLERAAGDERRGLESLLELVHMLERADGPALSPGAPLPGEPLPSPARRRLAALLAEHPRVRDHVDAAVARINGRPGDPRSFDAVEALLDDQRFRLAHWRVAAERINYRRFFDVADLVSVRAEDPRVFELMHRRVLELVRRGHVTGLRIDHVDGLWDPAGYLARLRDAAREAAGTADFYVVVEKILGADERLRSTWATHGTTGYEFTRAMGSVFVCEDNLELLDRVYSRFIGHAVRFADLVYEQKKRIIGELFTADFTRRARELRAFAAGDRHARDLSAAQLTAALLEVTACLSVYRTYIDGAPVAPDDRARIAAAVAEARARAPDPGAAAYDFVARTLLLADDDRLPPARRATRLDLVRRWQQLTGPATAKGLEDTALYQYHRLLSLNTVGGEPDPDPRSLAAAVFHAHNRRQQRDWPHALLATSTHDSKRGEDLRCRLHVLSDVPRAWGRALLRWSRLNQRHKTETTAGEAPFRNDEFLIYETLLGAWPLAEQDHAAFRERIDAYLVKAAREAKVHTSWIDQDPDYEAALVRFVDRVLDERDSAEFLADFRQLERRLAFFGALNSLSQLALKLASPGVPDFYQGTELWALTLVDPDNRRPVDFARRRDMLGALREAERGGARQLCSTLLASWHDGRIKLYVTYRGLATRRRAARAFEAGEYLPLRTTGDRAASVFAFARRAGDDWAICAVPMRIAQITGVGVAPLGRRVWRNTAIELPPGAPASWYDGVTGERRAATASGGLAVSDVFHTLPLALMTSAAPDTGAAV